MNETDLNTLFAQARAHTPADAQAAERLLARQSFQPSPVAVPLPVVRPLRAGWLALLATAAAITGVLVLRPAADSPAAAYQVYETALGDGW